MDKLKEHWFVITNSVFFLAVAVFYFVSVSGLEDEIKKKEGAIRSQLSSLRANLKKKPTPDWFEKLNKKIAETQDQIKDIREGIYERDKSFDVFLTEIPSSYVEEIPTDFVIYKDLLAKNYDDLKKKYCQVKQVGAAQQLPRNRRNAQNRFVKKASASDEDLLQGKPFLCSEEVLAEVEPKWLRTADLPVKEQIIEAQKHFWLVREILSICRDQKIIELKSMQILPKEGGSSDKKYQFAKGKDFWVYRDIKLEIVTPMSLKGEVATLMKAIDENSMFFRVVALSQKYNPQVPNKVDSNVPHIHFRNGPTPNVTLGLSVRHFDVNRVEESKEKDKKGAGR